MDVEVLNDNTYNNGGISGNRITKGDSDDNKDSHC